MKVAPLIIFVAMLLAAVPAATQDQATSPHAAFEQAIEGAKTAMMADPQRALEQSDLALQRATEMPAGQTHVARATAQWLKIEAYIGLNHLDEAEALVPDALELARRHAPNTKLHGDLTRAKGAIAGLRGRVQDALHAYLAAHRIFRSAGERRSQAIALQDIGQVYWEAGDYERMLRYYSEANELYDDDPGFSLTTRNNTGEALRMLGRGAEAEREYQAALENARELGSPLLQTRILSNLALVQVDIGKYAEAARNADRAERLGALAEAADWLPFVYGVQAKLAAARGQDARAGELLRRSFADADFAQTDLVYKEFHELGANLFERLGQPELALAHLRAFQRLDQQARALTSSASSQMLAARFDFANQNLRISQLKQGQLERDIEMERQRARYRTILFSGLLTAGLIVLGLVTSAFFQIRRSRNKVRDANALLTVSNAQLTDALKAKTDFLAMTSHEIRTPLNGILGMTQVILANRALDADTRGQVQLVNNAGETMRSLVDDLLDVAKMANGDVTVDIAPTALAPILQDAAALWSAEASAKGLQLETEFAEIPALVATDGNKVRQIALNLLSNAIKFTASGVVRLSVRRDADKGMLQIIVTDTGVGIPLDAQSRIFESFYQVDNAMTRQFSGTGLGLSICRTLAEALGGSISVRSEPSEGSCFCVELPFSGDEVVARTRPISLAASRVGLVEGNEMKRAVLAGLIEPYAASVVGVADPAGATDLLECGGTDLLVIDAMCAGSSLEGREALATLIGNAAQQQVATIVLAPSDGEIGTDDLAAFGATTVLIKPVRGAALIEALRLKFGCTDDATLTRAA